MTPSRYGAGSGNWAPSVLGTAGYQQRHHDVAPHHLTSFVCAFVWTAVRPLPDKMPATMNGCTEGMSDDRREAQWSRKRTQRLGSATIITPCAQSTVDSRLRIETPRARALLRNATPVGKVSVVCARSVA